MSNLEGRLSEISRPEMQEKTRLALASIEDQQMREAAAGYAMIGGLMAYGGGLKEDGWFAKISKFAPWFVLWTMMVIPVILFWQIML